VFSGGGLLALAFAVEGFELAALCERDTHAVATLRANFPADMKLAECDAEDFEPPSDLEVLFGGPPCQPYSRAGRQRGPDDPRDGFDHALRYARDSRPRIFVWENVPGVMDAKPKIAKWRKWWWAEVRKLGYEGVVWRCQAADYGTPQSRARVFFVGWRKGDPVGAALREPPPTTHARWSDPAVAAGKKLPWVPAGYRLTAGCCGMYGLYSCAWLNNGEGRCGTCLDRSNYTWAPNEEDEERTEVPPSVVPLMLDEAGARGQRRLEKQPPVDLAMDLPPRARMHYLAPTLTTSLAKGAPQGLVLTHGRGVASGNLAPGQLRYLSVRDAAKLQDVPQWYAFAGPRTAQMRQIGNGVPVNLGRAVARHVLRALGRPVPMPDSVASSAYSGLWPLGAESPCAAPRSELLVELRTRVQRERPAQRRLGRQARGAAGRVERLERALQLGSDEVERYGLADVQPGDTMQRHVLDVRHGD